MELERTAGRKLSLLAWAALCFAIPCAGVCPQPNPSVACEFMNSDAVFVGTVISARPVPPSGEEYDGWLYDLTVQKLFRGPRDKVIEVFTENSSGRFPLDVGKQYLLFASTTNGRLEITNCGNSAALPKADEAIRRLEGVKIPKDAEIEGRIGFSGIPDSGTHVIGIHVIIHGDGRTFRASSDRNGWFHLRVPPGNYSAEIEQNPKWDFTPYDLSYDNPSSFIARKGQCSGLQFLANPRQPRRP